MICRNIKLFGCTQQLSSCDTAYAATDRSVQRLWPPQATFSFSAAAGILWVAAFSGLLSPQRARRASLDHLKGSADTGPPAGDEQYDMAAETLAGSNGGPPGADPASVRRKQQQVCAM